MKTPILFVVLSMAAAVALAEDLKVGDTLLEGVRNYGPVNNGKVPVFHSRGMTIVSVYDLPQSVQRKLGVDPKKAKEMEQASLQEKAKSLPPSPDKYGESTPIRIINGQAYDFSKIIAWANTKYEADLSLRYSPPDFSGKSKTDVLYAKCRLLNPQNEKWLQFLVKGKVLQVLKDGLLVDCGSRNVFIRNYPAQNNLVDGKEIYAIAMPTGPYSYVNTLGARTTVEGYDFGSLPDGTVDGVVQPTLPKE